MASSSKKKTTFAKLNREAAVRDKRIEKQAKREARKHAAAVAASAPSEETTVFDADGEELPSEPVQDAA